ncbi:MAG: MG2 domain-containing protein, partial [Flavitalea sp.]
EAPDQLVFSPSKALAPATTFTASFKNDILHYSEFNSIGKTEKISFSTPALKLDNSNVTWVITDQASNSALPQLDIYFNYQVDPAAIREKLKITIDKNPVAFQVITLSPDTRISLRLNGIKAQEKDLQAVLSLDKGLLPKDGTNGTPDKIESQFMVPSPFNLTINEISAEHDGSAGEVYVRTSQQVIMDNIAAAINISPLVKFTTEQTDDGFVIKSDQFNSDKTYSLTLATSLRGRIGGVLREEYNNNIAFGELEPAIGFVNSKAVYLAGNGNKQIEVKIVNVAKVKVMISKIYESNLLLAQRYGYYPRNSDGDYYDDYDNNSYVELGDIIYEKEIETRSLPKYGNSRLFKFDIEDKLAEFKGIYHIKISSTTDNWINDSRFISKSDIGLIAKEGNEKLYVFANSLQSALPLAGVNLVVYGNNNQVLGTGVTKEDGVAEIGYTRKEYAGFRPAMVVAKTASDFNYLPFSNTRVNTSRFEIGGKSFNQTGLDAFIYAERDIYRPGERVNFSVIMRDRDWKVPGELPVVLKFLMPNGKELKTFRKTLNEQGSVTGEVDIAASAITGSYSLEVYTSNDVLLGSKSFSIEEFVPDRIKVTAKIDKKALAPEDAVSLNINAVNFFGPAAANRNYEAEIQVRSKYIYVKELNNYNFSIVNQALSQEKVVREGKTDASGNAVESYTVPALFKNMGLLQANFYATVFDETGRPVSRSASADIFTQDNFFGISDDGYSYYPLNQVIRFPVIAVNKELKVSSAKAQIKVIKHEYRTVLSKAGSYFRYESQVEDKILADQEANISGDKTTYAFTPKTPGNYELRISVPGANSYVSKSFYSYGSWGNDNSSFEVNTEGNIDISLDKEGYQPGESVRALFKAPFNGKMLVTLETDKVLSYQYLEVTNRTATLDLKLTDQHMPNVYVTASLIKPHTESDIPLTAAHGFQSIKVDAKSRKIPVEIVAAKSTRSRTHQKVTVKAAPGSYITLAAVDNGVLQVSGFQTPDPYDHFYAQRALQVNAYDMYPLLFPELRARMSSTGGDGELSMDKRTNPMPSKRVKLVSYWSGIAKAGSNGESNFEFDIPQFSGEIRLMAVAYKDKDFGSRESSITVADPLVLSSTIPRFMAPNDTITMPVNITNTTAKATTATATLHVTGPLKVIGNTTQSVSVNANSEGRALFRVAALPSITTGKIRVEVNGLNEKFTEETEIGVRPSAPLQIRNGSGSMNGAGNVAIKIPGADFLPGTSDHSLVVSRSPALELGKQMRYLVQYPYGCTEQTVSAAFPQLYYGDIAEQLSGNNRVASTNNRNSANYNVQEAIRKIKLRQLYNGGVTLWDGEGTENWWTSVYAAHFLIEAGKAGFEVDKKLLDGLLLFVNAKLKSRQTIVYYYNQKEKKKIAPKEVAYSLYVLALAGKPNVSVMNYYKANANLLSLDSKYLLSVAYAIGGDRSKFAEMLPGTFAGETAVTETGGSFSSDIRDEAIALNALLDVDPGNQQIGIMAKHVADKLKGRSWYSTQESSFALLAVGKIAKAAAKSTITADILVNGKSVGKSDGQLLKLTAAQLKGTDIQIATKGEGRLYYYWQAEGISASGSFVEEDNYLKVRRRFYDRYGNAISGNKFKQNDLVIVELALEKSYSESIENIVITDLLPAGFEIENPRTKEIPGMEWIKNSSSPTSLDVRDDRINLFVDLYNNRQVYYYAVRAVSPGVYRLGPVSADAMYNGEYHSYNGGGAIVVE